MARRGGLPAAFAVAAIVIAACGGPDSFPDRAAPPPPVERGQLEVGGLARTYRLYTPISLDRGRPSPLLLVLGGVGNDGQEMSRVTDYDRIAEEERFVVAYADGVDDTWNGGFCCLLGASAGPDDVAFLLGLIDDVGAGRNIDRARVYVAGISAGAMMAYKLGCDAADRIAGVAAVAGAMVLDACRPSRPVPVIHFHGTTDGLVPYLGGRSAGGATELAPPTAAVAERWAQLDGCPRPAVETTTGPLRTSSWTGCAGGTAVKLFTIEGGGHTWFATGLGPADGAVDASRAIWSFFEELAPRT